MTDFAAINPNQIRGYLGSNGWVEDGAIGEIASIWHRRAPEESEYEILSPETQTLRDYGSRVGDLIGVLARFERRQNKEVLNDISRLTPGVLVIVRHQEDSILQLKSKSVSRENVIKKQDDALDSMYKENLNLTRKVDYYRLATGLLIVALALCLVL